MSGHVFLSYSRSDRVYVERLATHWRHSGINVWFDEGIAPGEQFAAVLQARIDESVAVVVVMTPAAHRSPWVTREIHYALEVDKPLFPLVLIPGEPWFLLTERNRVDVTDGRMPPPELRKSLLGLLGSPVEAPAEAPRPPRRRWALIPAAATSAVAIVITIWHPWVKSVTLPPPIPLPTSSGGPATYGGIDTMIRVHQQQFGVLAVTGWARDRTAPERRLAIRVTATSNDTGRSIWTATTFAELGDEHGFAMAKPLPGGGSFVIRSWVLDSDKSYGLRADGVTVRPAPILAPPTVRRTGESTLAVTGPGVSGLQAYVDTPPGAGAAGLIGTPGESRENAVTMTLPRLRPGPHVVWLYRGELFWSTVRLTG